MVGPASETIQLIILVFGISRVACQCTSAKPLTSIDGMACQPFKYRNITVTKPQFCFLACVQISLCKASIYDKTERVCMLMNYPCVLLQPHSNHVYRRKHDCTRWVPDYEIDLAYWYIESGVQRSYVSRKVHDANMVIGKTTSDFFAVNPVDSTAINAGSHELLVVEPSCSVIWEAHDSTQVIPKKALIGGILTATNTPLYVARQNVSGSLIGGYYNPLNAKAWGSHSITRSNFVFEVMVVKSP